MSSAVFFGFGGVSLSIVLSCTRRYFADNDVLGLGASIGSLKSGATLGVCSSIDSKLGIGGILPLIMSGILSVYGLIVAVFISGNSTFIEGAQFI